MRNVDTDSRKKGTNNSSYDESKMNESFDLANFIVSIVAGLVSLFICKNIYDILINSIWKPLTIGISFTSFFIILLLIVGVFNIIKGNLDINFDKSSIIKGLITIVAFFVLSTSFEFIYEINPFNIKKGYLLPTSYVFVIDNSGSMDVSDPKGQRYEAINEILNDSQEDIPYAVYSFNQSLREESELSLISEGIPTYNIENTGGTDITNCLDDLFVIYKNSLEKKLGDNPRFLLLSDGYSSKWGLKSVVKKYAKTNVSISTVGLGEADRDLLESIAQITGGVYVDVDNIDDLEHSMKEAVTLSGNKYSRNLFDYRFVPSLDFLYGLVRILFTFILGFIISFSMRMFVSKHENISKFTIISLIKCIVAAIVLEFFINVFEWSVPLSNYIYCVLISLVVKHNFNSKSSISTNSYNENSYIEENRFINTKRLEDNTKSHTKGTKRLK